MIGCGFDFIKNVIFFTKNGGFLGNAFINVNIPTEENSLLYATVSIANYNE